MSRALIVGAGNIGFATGRFLATLGATVTYFDTSESVRTSLRAAGHSVADDLPTTAPCDLVCICVPTPTAEGQFVSVYVERAAHDVASLIASQDSPVTVVLRSTVLPGTMAGLVAPILASVAPRDSWQLAYWPSFARETFAFEDECAPHVVVIGVDDPANPPPALQTALSVAQPKPNWVPFRDAELVKYGSNLFNAVKISFYNALGAWAGPGADMQRVASLAAAAAEGNWNPGYGHRTVGLPFGGLCLPKDLEAFIDHLAHTGGAHADLLEAARAINEAMATPREALAEHAH